MPVNATETTPLPGVSVIPIFARPVVVVWLESSSTVTICVSLGVASASASGADDAKSTHTHSIIAILRFILFRSILIPSMMKNPFEFRLHLITFHLFMQATEPRCGLCIQNEQAPPFLPIWRKFFY